jgi:hypothetical protein
MVVGEEDWGKVAGEAGGERVGRGAGWVMVRGEEGWEMVAEGGGSVKVRGWADWEMLGRGAGWGRVVDWEELLKAQLVVVGRQVKQGCLHCKPQDQAAPAGGCKRHSMPRVIRQGSVEAVNNCITCSVYQEHRAHVNQGTHSLTVKKHSKMPQSLRSACWVPVGGRRPR